MLKKEKDKMIYSYYPGCTLKDRAKQLDICARKSAEALGITLQELPNWQCCGAVYPQVTGRNRLPAERGAGAADARKAASW